MPQTTYNYDMTPSFAGMLADSGNHDVRTYENGATAIAFGLGLAQGATARACKLPSAAGDKLIGIALHQHKAPDSAGVARYEAKEAVPVLSRGRAWVYSEQPVSPTDPVYVRHTANGAGTAAGQFRKDADTANAIAATNARFLTSTTAAGLVLVEVNLP